MLRERREEEKKIIEIIRRRNPNPPGVRITTAFSFSSNLRRMQGNSQ